MVSRTIWGEQNFAGRDELLGAPRPEWVRRLSVSKTLPPGIVRVTQILRNPWGDARRNPNREFPGQIDHHIPYLSYVSHILMMFIWSDSSPKRRKNVPFQREKFHFLREMTMRRIRSQTHQQSGNLGISRKSRMSRPR